MNQREKAHARAQRRRPTRRQRVRRWRRQGATDYLFALFAGTEELHYLSTRKGAFLAFLDGETAYGARFSYLVETDPGALDGARAPYNPGGAEAYD